VFGSEHSGRSFEGGICSQVQGARAFRGISEDQQDLREQLHAVRVSMEAEAARADAAEARAAKVEALLAQQQEAVLSFVLSPEASVSATLQNHPEKCKAVLDAVSSLS
jgi:hypothetical protein